LSAAIDIVATHGRVVVIGVCQEPDSIVPVKCMMKEVAIDFVMGYTKGEFEETIEALATGKIDAEPMITDVIGVDEVPAMFDALRSPGTRAKVLVEFPR
jgi:threonine dehydrogenase-like Zn-dependent dehydrogenase